MKFIYKEDIPGFLALPVGEQEGIERLAKKEVGKPMAILMEAFVWVIILTIPVLRNTWKPILGGDDAFWAALIIMIPLALLRVFVHNTMLINPRIKLIMEQKPNHQSASAGAPPAD